MRTVERMAANASEPAPWPRTSGIAGAAQESGSRRPEPPSRPRPRSIAFRRIAVCLSPGDFSIPAIELACTLADEHGATIGAIAAIEVPLEMPLDAADAAVESAAHDAVLHARAIVDSYGVAAEGVILHARDAGEAIVAEVAERRAELVVIASLRAGGRRSARLLPTTTEHVLKQAPCRVMLVGRPVGDRSGDGAPVFHAGRPSDYWPAGEFVDRIGKAATGRAAGSPPPAR